MKYIAIYYYMVVYRKLSLLLNSIITLSLLKKVLKAVTACNYSFSKLYTQYIGPECDNIS